MTIRLDAGLPPVALTAIPAIAQAAEALGFRGLWSNETVHDPFLPAALIAEHTHKLEFGTAVAIAFARSPATLAYTAWDLAQASKGRFILGLGTQVRAHIERRFGMPWPELGDGQTEGANRRSSGFLGYLAKWYAAESAGRLLSAQPDVAFLQPGTD